MTQLGISEAPSPLHNNLIANLVNGANECSDYDGDYSFQALERKLNYLSACSLKALSPLQQVVAFEQVQGMSDIDAATLCRSMVLTCRKQAAEVCLSLELTDDSQRWGSSYFAGVIAGQIATHWSRLGQKALEIDWAVSLSEIAKPTLEDGLPPSWHNTNLSISICATAMNAMQGVLHEYDTFNLFHRDRAQITSNLTDWLLEESREVAEQIAEHFPMTQPSQASLMQSLMKNGGAILAKLWNGYSRKVVTHYQDSASDEQKNYFRRNGYPLEDIKLAFQRQMQGMGAVSMKTMDAVTAQASLTEDTHLSMSSD